MSSFDGFMQHGDATCSHIEHMLCPFSLTYDAEGIIQIVQPPRHTTFAAVLHWNASTAKWTGHFKWKLTHRRYKQIGTGITTETTDLYLYEQTNRQTINVQFNYRMRYINVISIQYSLRDQNDICIYVSSNAACRTVGNQLQRIASGVNRYSSTRWMETCYWFTINVY